VIRIDMSEYMESIRQPLLGAPRIRRYEEGATHREVRQKPYPWCCSMNREATRRFSLLCKFSTMEAYR